MEPTPVAERIDGLLEASDLFVPSARVVDLLLDVRNEVRHPVVRVHVDRDLTAIGSRHLLTAVEVQQMLERLVPVLRLVWSRPRSHGGVGSGAVVRGRGQVE
jgi:hypothetical protein